MFTISRQFTFCYAHRLLNYSGACSHPHGHNGLVRITLCSETLNDAGMVVDFGNLKQTMGYWIEENLDHRMVLHPADPLVPVLKKMNEPVYLMTENPTAECFAKLLFEQAVQFGFPVESVTFWETEKCFAEYRKESL